MSNRTTTWARTGARVRELLRGTANRARLLGLACVIGAGSVQAAPPTATEWDTRGCDGCHLLPTQYSGTSGAPNDGRGGTTLAGHLSANMGDVVEFWNKLKAAGAPMSTFADAVAADAAAAAVSVPLDNVYRYLLAIRDGHVESMSPVGTVATASPGVTSTIAFGTQTNGVDSVNATITVTNLRSRSITYGDPAASLSGSADFAVIGQSCPTRVVVTNASCTITIRFLPGAVAGSQTANLTLSFSTDGLEAVPASRQFQFTGSSNIRPVASAGADQSVPRSSTVTLDSSGSSDANGNALTRAWSFTSVPAGSTATLSNAAAASPTFVADRLGTYVVSLVVNDGLVSSVADSVTITSTNTAPVANAGPAQSVTAPVTVTLDGSGSFDANGDGLSYAWTLTRPAGSSAVLSNSAAVNPSFVADRAGTYTASLVVSDGLASSAASTVTITAGNSAPVANAGPAQSVTAPVTVTLNGSGSSDPNGDTITYAWTLSTRPTGSVAVLSSASVQQPTFQADKRGTYIASLVVNDGVASSAASQVTITAANTAPVASAGPAQSVLVNATVTLDGSGSSDANGDTLTYSWVLASRPAGSTATLSSTTVAAPTFVPDLAGNYTATLVVNDGVASSAAASVTIAAAVGNAAPIANAGTSRTVTRGSTVTLDGRASSDADNDTLTFAWTLTTRPAGSAAALSSTTSAQPSFVADQAGSYVATLVVNDGTVASAPSSVTITSNSAPVANAGAAQVVVLGATVTLNGSLSSDAENDPLTYAWSLTSRPAGSVVGLNAAATATPNFVPDLAGAYVASLIVNDGKTSSAAATVNITVTPPPAVFALSAPTLNLSAVAGSSSTGSVVISNVGGTALTLNSLDFSGAASSEYTLDASNACTASLSIAAGSSCTLVLRFAPLAAGSRDASLSITHSAAGSPGQLTLRGTATPAPAPRIELSDLVLAFGDVTRGGVATRTVTVRNSGAVALSFSGFVFGGAAPGDFERSGDCSVGTALAAGAQCSLVVGFRPTAVGDRRASLTLQSDASNGPATLSLSGNGVAAPAPAVGLSATTLDFGVQTVGGIYPPRILRLTNTGNADLSSIVVSIEGLGFTAAGPGTCTNILVPGDGCDIPVLFDPPAVATSFSGSVRVASNAAGSPHRVALAGRGSAAAVPVLVWQPAVSALDFGNVSAGGVSAAQSATLLNQGPGGVTIQLINAVGSGNSAFTFAGGTCRVGEALFEGASCTIDIRFAPSGAGARTAQVQVASTGAFPPTLQLRGTGLGGPVPTMSLSATTADFGDTRVGTQSLPVEIVVSSAGSGVLQVSAMTVSGPYSVQSRTCPALPFSLPAGSDCSIVVSFAPQAEGDLAGTLSIVSDANAEPTEVTLSGHGEPAADLSSGGGCSLAAGDSATDPTLWTLVLLAVLVLLHRRRARRRP